MFETVAVLRDPCEAHLLRGRLEAEDIAAIVIHEHHIGMKWYLSFALGGVKVQVPELRREDAMNVADLAREGEYKELLREQFGELDDPRCPYCGCEEYERRRPYPRAALAILYSGLVGPMLPPKGWLYGCKACGAAYRHELCRSHWGRWPLTFLIVTVHLAFVASVVWSLFTTRLGLAAIVVALAVLAPWTARTLLNNEPEETDRTGSI